MLSMVHSKTSTPSKEDICSQISSLFKVKKDFIVVSGCRTRFGTNQTQCDVRIYNSVDTLKAVEKKSIVKRKTGEEEEVVPRRQRKDARKKKAKIFGTMRKYIKKAEKKKGRK